MSRPWPQRANGARPSVTVIVPVRDCEQYLAAAIESVLAEGYEPLEIVVVDDGSTDASADVARSLPVRLVSRPHAGVAAARNTGLDEAGGELIAFLDADDQWVPGSLGARADHLMRHGLDYVLGNMEIFLEPGLTAPDWLPSGWLTAPQHGLLTTLLARRGLFDVVGRFDETFPQGEDTEWIARLKDANRPGERLDLVCARYRLHGGNLTHQDRSVVGPLLIRTVRESLDRQRRGADPQP
jgi:glycosyltransferase involved in cell wall biosynthesis